MIDAKRTPLDLIDTVYTLAYWMTGSEAATNELFRRTYNAAEIDASETHFKIPTPDPEGFSYFSRTQVPSPPYPSVSPPPYPAQQEPEAELRYDNIGSQRFKHRL